MTYYPTADMRPAVAGHLGAEMERKDVTRLLGVLKAAWPDRTIGEDTVTAYEMAWCDLPADLGQRAVAEYIRTGKFFPAPAEIRELALRAGLGLPAAEIAWAEAQRVMSGFRPGDAPPLWSSKVLEDAVNAIGWWSIKHCDADNLGTIRAQFRDTFNALLKATAAGDARAALDDASDRQALREQCREALPEAPPMLPVAPTGDGESWTLRKFRERFEAQQNDVDRRAGRYPRSIGATP